MRGLNVKIGELMIINRNIFIRIIPNPAGVCWMVVATAPWKVPFLFLPLSHRCALVQLK